MSRIILRISCAPTGSVVIRIGPNCHSIVVDRPMILVLPFAPRLSITAYWANQTQTVYYHLLCAPCQILSVAFRAHAPQSKQSFTLHDGTYHLPISGCLQFRSK